MTVLISALCALTVQYTSLKDLEKKGKEPEWPGVGKKQTTAQRIGLAGQPGNRSSGGGQS